MSRYDEVRAIRGLHGDKHEGVSISEIRALDWGHLPVESDAYRAEIERRKTIMRGLHASAVLRHARESNPVGFGCFIHIPGRRGVMAERRGARITFRGNPLSDTGRQY